MAPRVCSPKAAAQSAAQGRGVGAASPGCGPGPLVGESAHPQLPPSLSVSLRVLRFHCPWLSPAPRTLPSPQGESRDQPPLSRLLSSPPVRSGGQGRAQPPACWPQQHLQRSLESATLPDPRTAPPTLSLTLATRPGIPRANTRTLPVRSDQGAGTQRPSRQGAGSARPVCQTPAPPPRAATTCGSACLRGDLQGHLNPTSSTKGSDPRPPPPQAARPGSPERHLSRAPATAARPPPAPRHQWGGGELAESSCLQTPCRHGRARPHFPCRTPLRSALQKSP